MTFSHDSLMTFKSIFILKGELLKESLWGHIIFFLSSPFTLRKGFFDMETK